MAAPLKRTGSVILLTESALRCNYSRTLQEIRATATGCGTLPTWCNPKSIGFRYISKSSILFGRRAILEGKRHRHECLTCCQNNVLTLQRRSNSYDCNNSKKFVLGIETSCDDTGVSIVDSEGNVVGDAIDSQTATHVSFGGILPLVARDLHTKNIQRVTQECLDDARMTMEQIDAIAVTVKPGLMYSLMVGVEYAKKLAIEKRKPIIPIHHMKAHALTARMDNKIDFPFLVLLISGGHCLLAVARDVDEFLLLGASLDDAPGDAFDKVARDLKLKNIPGFYEMSGGRAIEKLALDGDPKAFDHIHILSHHHDCNFSFAGLKSSYKTIIQKEEKKYGIHGGQVLPNVSDICASFQYSVLFHLAKRIQRAITFCAAHQYLPDEGGHLVVSGGVASNMFLRNGIENVCKHYNYNLVCPPPHLCTDNGIMIAWNGMEKLLSGKEVFVDPENLEAMPKCPLGEDISNEVKRSHFKLPRIKIL